MRALIVAKKDFRDAIRSWELWGLMVLFTIFTAGLFYALNASSLLSLAWPSFLEFFGGSNFGISTVEFVGFYIGLAEAAIPIVALTVTHKAIAGEVESGSVKFLISAPLTRFDAVLGKVIGRAATMWTALAMGFVVSILVIILLGGEFSPVPYLLFVVLTCVFTLAYVSIGVGLSALADSASQAVLYVISFFMAVGILMDFAGNLVYFFVEGEMSTFFPQRLPSDGIGQGPPDAPGWFFLIPRLAPGRAFNQAVVGIVTDQQYSFAPVFPDGIPFYLTEWAMLLILLAWIVVPVGVGYWYFNRSDIN